MRPLHIGSPVIFNGGAGSEKQLAFVVEKHSDEMLTLLVFDANGQGSIKSSVPRRSPADYGPEGGGMTWFYV